MKTEEKALEYLTEEKLKKTKIAHTKHEKIEMADYLRPSNIKIKNKEAQQIFLIRARMIDVKNNYKGKYKNNLECDQCKKKNIQINETQEHILNCMEICDKKVKIPKYEEMFGSNVRIKLEIAKILTNHIKIRDDINLKNK